MAATRKKIPLITEDATLNIAAGKTLDISGADVSIVGSGAAVITFPSTTSTLAKITDITGTNSNTNTGDQTSIVGITGTKAQFDTAVTDGNITYDGDAPTAHKASHEDGGADEISIAGLAGTPADLSTHESDTTTHGTTGDIVGTTDTQTLTNKTLNNTNNTVAPSHPYSAKAYLTGTDQTLTTGTYTKVELNAEAWDLNSDFDLVNHKYVVPVTGIYQINAMIRWDATADVSYDMLIRIGADNNFLFDFGQASKTGAFSTKASCKLLLTANDEIALFARQSSGGNSVIDAGGEAFTFLDIELTNLKTT